MDRCDGAEVRAITELTMTELQYFVTICTLLGFYEKSKLDIMFSDVVLYRNGVVLIYDLDFGGREL